MAKPKTVAEIRAALIDEAATLNEKLAPFRDDIKRLEAIKKKARSWAETDKLPTGESYLYVGTKGVIMLGPCENKRTWKKGAFAVIFKLLGVEKFLAACSLTFEAATEAIGEEKVAELVDEGTGSRALTIAKAA